MPRRPLIDSLERVTGVILLGDSGALLGATAQAERLLARVAQPGGIPGVLGSLHARASSVHQRHPVVATLVTTTRGALVLTAERAGPHVAVTIEAADAPPTGALAELSPREGDVAGLVLQGLPTKTIAHQLGISPWTVTAHLRSIFAKNGVSTRAQLAALAMADLPAAG